MDSDDFIEPETIDTMVNQAEQYDADAVFASADTYIAETNNYGGCFCFPEYLVLSGQACIANLVCKNLRQNVSPTVWNILFNLLFLKRNNLHFFGRNTEDYLFFSTYYYRIKKAVFLPNITYHYTIRNHSLMGYNRRESIPILK